MATCTIFRFSVVAFVILFHLLDVEADDIQIIGEKTYDVINIDCEYTYSTNLYINSLTLMGTSPMSGNKHWFCEDQFLFTVFLLIFTFATNYPFKFMVPIDRGYRFLSHTFQKLK